MTVVSLAQEVWGSETSILTLAPHLADCGVDVTIAAPGTGDFARAATGAGVRFRSLQLPPHRGVVDARGSIWSTASNAAREIGRVARGARQVSRYTGDADVVHCNSLLANLDCALSGRLHRRASVIEIHDLVRAGTSRRLLSATLRLADAAIAVSRSVARNVERWSSARVHLIPQAVDTALFTPGPRDAGVRSRLTARPDEPVVAIIGRIDAVKGVHRVVEAVAEMNRRGTACALAVVGKPSAGNEVYAEHVRAEAVRRLGDRARFVGQCQDVAAVLRSVDVVVNASSIEPFGLSVLEAMACGVPVIASNTGGLPDFVVDGVTGLLCNVHTPGELERKLHEVIERPDAAGRRARQALELVQTTHSLPVRARAVADLYHHVADKRRRAA